jgi:hypothetical protein
MIRCFLAIDLPEDLRPGLALVQGELKRAQADVRWVLPGNIHITLKFFGNVPDNEIPAIVAAAREVAAGQGPLTLKVTGAGAFPNVRSPRVVWPDPVFSPPGKSLRGPGLPPGEPGLQPAPDPGPGALAGRPGPTFPGHRKAGGGLAAVCGAGDHFIPERALAQGLNLYAVGDN